MTRSQMQSTVIQCIILTFLTLIVSHELGRNTFDSVWDDPMFKNLTATFNMTSVKTNATTPGNATVIIPTKGDHPLSLQTESFYTKSLWVEIFIYSLLCPLNYYWHIYLERCFPVRPRGVEIDYSKSEKSGLDVNEGEEEEVVQRWIAQGKVRRSSISWWNTFAKWILDRTVGNLCSIALHYWLEGLLRSRSSSHMSQKFKSAVFFSFFLSFFGLAPFTSLIGFIVIPAAKRPIFEAGGNMVMQIFLSVFLNLVVPWAIRTDVAQYALGNMTEGYYMGEAHGKAGSGNGPLEIGGRVGDEL